MTSAQAEQFDTYARRARLYPALLLVLPVAASIVLLWPGLSLEKVVPLLITAGVPFLAGNLVRGAGKSLEGHLFVKWHGLPTTHMLRVVSDADNEPLRMRRREQLGRLTSRLLPTSSEELAEPATADKEYIAATRILITRVRDQRERFPLVQEENINYGFRRNLRALKPFGLFVLLVMVGCDGWAYLLHRPPELVLASLMLHVVLAAIWLLMVRSNWVWSAAQSYAERLFEALESLDDRSSGKQGDRDE